MLACHAGGPGWSPVAAAQFFLVKPRNVTVVEGHTVVLPCHVGNQAGRVQWSKDGFVLGEFLTLVTSLARFERDIPGYPRYSMLGNQAEGIHNLQIDEATIEDDGDYQCQVGPTLTEKAIRANATLTVLVPPRSIQFEGRANGSLVEVHQRESVRLACVVEGSKPAPQLRWYRNNVEIRPDSAKLRVEETEERRQTAEDYVQASGSACYVSNANTPPRARDQLYGCVDPPGAPEIEGYQEGETLRAGDDVALTCTARGGNPPAELNWYRGSERLASRDGVLEFTVAPGDNGAVLRCEARNSVTPRPMAASVKLAVHFAPARVTVTGPREAKEGQSVTLSCATAPSNPPAEVSWVGDGRPLPSTSSSTSPHPAGGLCHHLQRHCHCRTSDPPSEPSILGYQAGTPVRAGAVHRMTCVTRGGNPLPTVRWFRGEREVPGTSTTTNDNVVSTELELVARESDNGAEFRCEASNTASAVPKSVSVRLTVHSVSLKVQPKVIKAGQKAVLVCESGGSNPEAVLSWWRDGFLLSPDHLDISTFDTPFGGRGQRATLSLNVSAADDGRSFTCQAANPALDVEAAVHEVATLRVL
ncbi:NPHS1, partial [Cordylochernes scorpioides]